MGEGDHQWWVFPKNLKSASQSLFFPKTVCQVLCANPPRQDWGRSQLSAATPSQEVDPSNTCGLLQNLTPDEAQGSSPCLISQLQDPQDL